MSCVTISTVRCKGVLNKSAIGFADWTLNPYGGCAFGCSYCYVPLMKAKQGVELPGPWGSYVQVKLNAVEVLRNATRRVKPGERIGIGTATDPYQPAESRFRITRSVLEQLCFYDNRVSITTRSPLVLRDLDVLQRLPCPTVNMSVPAADDRIRRVFEPNSPAIPGRLEAVRRLKEAGITVNLLWAPLIPGVTDTEAGIEEALQCFASIGVPIFVTGMRGGHQFIASHADSMRGLVRLRGLDSTQLYGASVGQAILATAQRLGASVEMSPDLLGGSYRPRPSRIVRPRNPRDVQRRLVV